MGEVEEKRFLWQGRGVDHFVRENVKSKKTQEKNMLELWNTIKKEKPKDDNEQMRPRSKA